MSSKNAGAGGSSTGGGGAGSKAASGSGSGRGPKGPVRDYTRDYQDRPARKQVEYKQTQSIENAGTYNIWYSKWSGDGSRFGKGLEKAQTRCILERDAGKTKAGKKGLFCIHFARGCCSKGKDCTFLHRIPMPGDRSETTIDCFGRDKHRMERDDMGGVGSFERLNTTLYVGHVSIGDDMERIVRKHFSEWGEIEHINILKDKGVAFVRYVSIANAEFAKEAMYAQTLDSGEVLNVRWATDDPNPRVIAENKRKAEKMVEQAVLARLPQLGETGTIADYERSFKQQRLEASAPSADEVAAMHKSQAQQVLGLPHFAPDGAAASAAAPTPGAVPTGPAAAAAYYNYYAYYGYVPSPDGSTFVHDPARASAMIASGAFAAMAAGAALPSTPALEPSASSAYAIPVKKPDAQAQPATASKDGASDAAKPADAATPAAKPAAKASGVAALVSGYASSGDEDDDDDDDE
ncbi:Pre-mRNA-splicing factor [Polyrhizophydium stewartii]|uniref:Pre-mRNA-splicing factor n=1 Tax=Polyrhizophydium stewartii TaxID=2732419 RepID=A0ABR4N9V5_9FUNG|nr:Pre-mRNA-splicing factor [Polyrhizophydium stewartii]